MPSIEKKRVKFGGYQKNPYLCIVKMNILTTPLSAGSKPVSKLLHLKATFGWLLFFIPFPEQPMKLRTDCEVAVYCNLFLSLKNQHLHCIAIDFEIGFDV